MALEMLEGVVSSASAAAVSVPVLAKQMNCRQACRSSVCAIVLHLHQTGGPNRRILNFRLAHS